MSGNCVADALEMMQELINKTLKISELSEVIV